MRYPALDVRHDDCGLVLAVVDDYGPSAVEEGDGFLRIFFADRAGRDGARDAIGRAFPWAVTTQREIDDEDWARRSQQNLEPISVGRITVLPHPLSTAVVPRSQVADCGSMLTIVIPPSMGFGTGHHATTRLCLAALQTIDLAGASVVDIGTGSGVLAIAARRLGAGRVAGIDSDPDAVQAARESLVMNPGLDAVTFEHADLTSWLAPPPLAPGRWPADVVTANLTGALLVREAASIASAVVPGGTLIVSGLMTAERDDVVSASERAANFRVLWESQEDEWVGLLLGAPGSRAQG